MVSGLDMGIWIGCIASEGAMVRLCERLYDYGTETYFICLKGSILIHLAAWLTWDMVSRWPE
jgi:hypothetical protein